MDVVGYSLYESGQAKNDNIDRSVFERIVSAVQDMGELGCTNDDKA